MSICQAVTSAGRPCACKARDGYDTCGRHKNTQVVEVDLTRCGQFKTDGSRCTKQCAHDDHLCKLHRTITERHEQLRRSDILWVEAMELLWGIDPPDTFQDLSAAAEDMFDRGWIYMESVHDNLIGRLHEEWVWFRRERVLPTAQAKTHLQRLALDNQNVHTKEVNKLTTDSMKFLLETPVPDGQETVAELETAWTDKSKKKVMRDVKMWYGMKTCVQESDWLYKKMLDGLWVRIKEHKERDELTQRLWEEAFESVDKCCQGHLSRLANVLVGFTEEVQAEVPLGEILQQRIAAIAAKEIGVEYKVCEAWTVFEELKIPMEERDAWIEAF